MKFAAGWSLAPTPEDGASVRTEATVAGAGQQTAAADADLSSPASRGDELPYAAGDFDGLDDADEEAELEAGGEPPAATEPVELSPRTSEPGTALWAPQSPQPLSVLFPRSPQPWLPMPPLGLTFHREQRAVYRSDDGYVHVSLAVLKANGLWDESWDASDGTPFINHISCLGARHAVDQEQIHVLTEHRDLLYKDRAMQKYKNVSAEIGELRQQVQDLCEALKIVEQQWVDAAKTARKEEAVRAADVTPLRSTA